MLEHPKDHLARRAQQLGLERGEVLSEVQQLLDDLYPTQTRAVSLNNAVLKVITPSSAVAQELRLRQIELLAQFNALSPAHAISKLQIQIRSLE